MAEERKEAEMKRLFELASFAFLEIRNYIAGRERGFINFEKLKELLKNEIATRPVIEQTDKFYFAIRKSLENVYNRQIGIQDLPIELTKLRSKLEGFLTLPKEEQTKIELFCYEFGGYAARS